MEIQMDCASCPGRLRFAGRRNRSKGRLVGACDTCGSVFTLSGGRVAPLDSSPVLRYPTWVAGPFAGRERDPASSWAGRPSVID